MRMGYRDYSKLLQCIVFGCGTLLQCAVTHTSNTATHCNSTIGHGDCGALLQCVGTPTSNTTTHCNSTLVLRPRCSVIMSPLTYVNGTRKLQHVVAVCSCGNTAQFCCGSVTSAVQGCSVLLPRAKTSDFARCSNTLQPCTVWCCSVVLQCGAAVWCCSVVLQYGAAVWCCRVRRHHDTLKTQQTFAVAVLQCCCSVVQCSVAVCDCCFGAVLLQCCCSVGAVWCSAMLQYATTVCEHMMTDYNTATFCCAPCCSVVAACGRGVAVLLQYFCSVLQ